MVVTIWLCPNDCATALAQSRFEDLSQIWNRDIKNERTTTRDRCAGCGGRRVPHTVPTGPIRVAALSHAAYGGQTE